MTRSPARLSRFAAALIAAALAVAAPAWAQMPTSPIHIVVPFAPGASTDIVLRRIAPKLSELLGQSVVIENRGGAGGLVAADTVLRAPADGSFLLVATTSFSALPALQMKLPYDTVADFAPLALLADMPGVLVINPEMPVNTLGAFLDYAKSHDVYYGSAGPGTFPHLGMALLASRAGVKLIHVPYKGAAPALLDVMGGQLQAKLDSYVTSGPHLAAGKLRAIAVSSLTRIPELPDTPTVAESGFPGYEVNYWIGVVAPAKVPAPVRETLERALMASLTPGNRAALQDGGVRPLGQDSHALDALIRRELVQWQDLVTTAHITVN
jgi:tripartite-type tricarboxylate transporter receptor subunit TctC